MACEKCNTEPAKAKLLTFETPESILSNEVIEASNKSSNLMEPKTYQVALSFAGEQREYVEDVAIHLQRRSIALFYDGFEQISLWGTDGVEAFHEAIAHRAAYVVMFISREYVQKAWPTHERRSAFSRMVLNQEDCILPVRFDDTPVPGLPEAIIYLRARDFTPAELAANIAQRLGVSPYSGKASDVPPPRMKSPIGEAAFDYSSYNGRYIIGVGAFEFETNWTKASRTSIHVYNDPTSINGVAVTKISNSIFEISNAVDLDFTSRTRTPRIGEIAVFRNVHGFYAAVQVLEIKDDTRGDDRDELRFRYAIQTDGSDDFSALVGI